MKCYNFHRSFFCISLVSAKGDLLVSFFGDYKWKQALEEGSGYHTVQYADSALVSVLCTPLSAPSVCIPVSVEPLVQDSHSPGNKLPVCAVVRERYCLATWGAGGCLDVKLVI